MGNRLVVISNRVPVPDVDGPPSAGGLAVAVLAALRGREGIWFGWSGQVSDMPAEEPRVQEADEISYVIIDLKEQDFEEYYNGYANRVLWPILHYRVNLAEFTRADLGGYVRVNQRFALALSGILRPDDLVWVHDYHLMPLARLLRARGHYNRIGFFLHIPVPPPDILAVLPHHADIIGSLIDYDLVGVQTANDRDNLRRYLRSQGAERTADPDVLALPDRRVRLGAYPVGIETEAFMRMARAAEGSEIVAEMQESLGGRFLVIGVDRLDYSKGITHRLDAVERFLAQAPDWRARGTFLQVTPKSRVEIPEYSDLQESVSGMAGRINGAYGDVTWTPIRYVNRSYSREELASLYRLARVGLVTPLRDGMNLVAKEYVAAQDPADPGVLVLSKFAGAAAELDRALLVNPHEPEAVAAAILRALEMPLDERIARHSAMLDLLRRNDVSHWAEAFLVDLAGHPAFSEGMPTEP